MMRTAALVSAVALMMFTTLANAQDDEATQRVRHGVELRQSGQEDAALAEFQGAYALSHRPIALAQMGLVEQALGHWVDAEAHVREALAAGADAWVARNRAALDEAYAVIQQHVGRLDVRGGVAGAEVLVNGAVIGHLPLAEPVRLEAGTVTLEVRADGYYPVRRSAMIPPGGLGRESVELRRSVENDAGTSLAGRGATPIATSQSDPPSNAYQAVSLVAALGALGSLGGAVGLLAWRESQIADDRMRCGEFGSSCPPEDRASLMTSSTTQYVGAIVLFGVAGVLALAAGFTFALAPSRPAARRITLDAGPTRVGLGFTWNF